MNRDLYEKAVKHYGLRSSIEINGDEWVYVPTDVVPLLFWAATRCAEPIFSEKGVLIDWNVLDVDSRKNIKIIVETALRNNSMELCGGDDVFGDESASKLLVEILVESIPLSENRDN